MVVFHPQARPAVLSESGRDAEREVWGIFENLEDPWHVFYSVTEISGDGYDREVDYVLVWCNRILYIEVKGGQVAVNQRASGIARWQRTRRDGTPLRPIRPAQLWDAKKAVQAAVKATLGSSPAELGFLEYEFYVFPHTSRAVTQGQTFDGEFVRYVFNEDMAAWPQQLNELVRARIGQFVPPETIAAVINSLHRLSCPTDAPVIWPDAMTAVPAFHSAASVTTRSSMDTGGALPIQPVIIVQPSRRIDRIWWKVLFALAGAAILLWYWSRPLNSQHVAAPKMVAPVGSQKALPARVNGQEKNYAGRHLPAFIPNEAAAVVERTMLKADQTRTTEAWQYGQIRGFATLQAEEPNGCRRYRITRNDTQPIGLQFVERCS